MLKIKAEGSMGRYPPRAPPAGDCPLEAPHRLRLVKSFVTKIYCGGING
jgi:hypothetical protein